jgi:predicted AAA+ superfamily ATPase
VSQRDRILFFDVGVRNALLGVHRHAPAATELGRLFEHWLTLQCLYFIRAHRLPWKISSYRTDAGAEVDIVLDTRRALIAIECKAGRSVTRAELGGLRSFGTAARRAVHSLVVYRGERRQKLDTGVEAVPYGEFLGEMLPSFVR